MLSFACINIYIFLIQVTAIHSTIGHSHEADYVGNEALKVRADIKASALANRGQPGQIITDKLSLQPKEVITRPNKNLKW